MKKSFLSVFIVTTTILVPTLTFPSLANDCPKIPEKTELTVTNNEATLRNEPKYSESNKGKPSIYKDSKLIVISSQPSQGKGKDGNTYCWYQVSSVNDKGKYWIPNVSFKEFTKFLDKSNVESSPEKLTSPSLAGNQNPQQDTSIPLQLHLVLILSGLGIIINALILLLFYRELEKILHYLNLPSFLKNQKGNNKRRQSIDNDNFREQIQSIVSEKLSQFDLPKIKTNLDKVSKDLGLEDKKTNLSPVNPNFPIDTYKNKDSVIDSPKQTTKETLSQILDQLAIIVNDQKQIITFNDLNEVKMNEFSKFIQELQQQILQNQEAVVKPDQASQEFQDADSNSSPYTSSELSQELTELVAQFNHQNREPFNDSRFQALKLTQQSTQGQVGLNAHRILELEMCTDNSQASYLKFEMDGENWLIPNITSSYISQIMRNLDENRDIFVIHPGSGTLQLLRPAKLKNIGSNLWGIEEPGEFTQQQ
ncbi:MAG: hypothetical protein VKL41_00380 [Snowella sp.]|nr:hypothetical protein [Snowella sp.]